MSGHIGRRVVLKGDDKAHTIREVRPFGGMGDTLFTLCGKMRLVAFTADADDHTPECEACNEVRRVR